MPRVAPTVVAAHLLPLLTCAVVSGQFGGGRMELRHSYSDGWHLAAAGDLNQDGYADFVVQDPPDHSISINYIYARSGRDGGRLEVAERVALITRSVIRYSGTLAHGRRTNVRRQSP